MQRQLAIKILAIFVVGLLLLIPTTMVKHKVLERHGYQRLASAAVAQAWTGPQLLSTPVLVIPYQISAVSKSGFYSDKELGNLSRLQIILPDKVHTDIELANKTVFKGIYEIAVFDSTAEISGVFSVLTLTQGLAKITQEPRFVSRGKPYLALHIGDVRGISTTPSLTVRDRPLPLEPGSGLTSMPGGLHADLGKFSERVEPLSFKMGLALRGMGRISFVPLAGEAETRMRSNWPHPEFIGNTLPTEREISSAGFEASWASTRYSNNSAGFLDECIATNDCQRLLNSSSGVNFIEPVDVYLQSERSVKYAVLFIGLSFISFFIFEHLKHIRIHPIQYAFVGLAIALFYLLLISLAEHIAFHLAYSIAVACCAALLLFYVRYMLRSFRLALLFTSMITVLYGLLYVIVQAEDFALLMGAMLVFCLLAILMYVTRQIDWYNLAPSEEGG